MQHLGSIHTQERKTAESIREATELETENKCLKALVRLGHGQAAADLRAELVRMAGEEETHAVR